MKCIILVAGYATRMYPLTINKPKALLELNGSTILDNILNNIINSYQEIDEYILVTNSFFYNDFINWKLKTGYKEKITIISNGSTSIENSIGAVNNLMNTIKLFHLDDDIFVLAGDNILDFSLDYIFEEFISHNHSCVMYYDEFNKEKLRKTGVIELNEEGYIISMEEKSSNPKTNHAVPPFYWLKRADIKKMITIFNDDTKQFENMGEIILHLCKVTKIHAILMNGNRYSMDYKEEYDKVSKVMKK